MDEETKGGEERKKFSKERESQFSSLTAQQEPFIKFTAARHQAGQ